MRILDTTLGAEVWLVSHPRTYLSLIIAGLVPAVVRHRH